MQWEYIPVGSFKEWLDKSGGVCVLSMGVIEKHGMHLPLGTDFLSAHLVAAAAAEIEPAVVFPPYYFGAVSESMCFPGAVVIKPELLNSITQAVLDEIGRNGFKKIILYNWHGGSTEWLHYLVRCQKYEQKSYEVYYYTKSMPREAYELLKTGAAHAGEAETSVMMTKYDGYIRKDLITEAPQPLKRQGHLPDTVTPYNYMANYPDHLGGDARPASKETGRKLVEIISRDLARYIKTIKDDTDVKKLSDEFFEKVRNV